MLLHYWTRPLNALALLWAGLVAAALLVAFAATGYDDPYITYRYAYNLAAGTGFVYNAGEYVLSTTAPLYAVLLAGGRLLGFDIPLLSNTIGCLSLAGGGLVFWRLGQVWQAPLIGTAGLVLYPTFPLLITTLGAETLWYLLLILLGLLACAEQRYNQAAIWLALATLTRADAAVAVVAVGTYVLVMRRGRLRNLPWRAALFYVGLLLPWVVFAWAYFGAPLPVTLAAKQRQGLMSISSSFFEGLIAQVQLYWQIHFYALHFGLLLPGLLLLLTRQWHWLLLVGWSLLYVVAYSLLGVTSYFWYYAPVVVGFVALVGAGVAMAGVLARRWLARTSAAAVGGLLITLLLVPQLLSLSFLYNNPDMRRADYQRVGEWLHDATPPDARVGVLEVGIIGYYARRPMVDFAGLLQPQTALQLTASTTYTDATIWATRHFQPDYLVLHEGFFQQLDSEEDLRTRCQSVRRFERSAQPALLVYRCSW